MARIEPLTNDQAPAPARTVLEDLEAKLGKAPNYYRTLAHAPAAMQAYLKMGEALKGGVLGAQNLERVALRVAATNGCGYCASAHTAVGKMVGLPAAEVEAGLEGRSDDARSQALLRLVDSLLSKQGRLSDADLAEARAHDLGEAEILEAVAATAMNIFSNTVNHVALTEIDFPRVELDNAFEG